MAVRKAIYSSKLVLKDVVAGEMSQRLIARTLTSEIYDFMNVMSGSLKVTAERDSSPVRGTSKT